MYQTHPTFIPPSNQNAKIWRYIDFPKLVSLIERRGLYFVRASKLDDPYEGLMPQFNRTNRRELYATERPKFKTQEEFERFLISTGGIDEFMPHQKEIVLINSWHLNEFESASMWQSYSRDNRGIAIQSTFSSLCESFNDNSKDIVWIGKVRYIDYMTEAVPEWNTMETCVTKRKSFEAENELRAVTVLPFPFIKDIFAPNSFSSEDFAKAEQVRNSGELDENGKFVSTDMEKLVEKIYVAPKSDKWFKDTVQSVLAKYGLSKEVVRSNLYDLT